MKIVLLLSLLLSGFAQASINEGFSKMAKSAIQYKDFPAVCWHLGVAEGYIRGLAKAGNAKATQFVKEIKVGEKCTQFDLKNPDKGIVNADWVALSELQKKLETATF